jgi:ketosteroid isomerase-like protein
MLVRAHLAENILPARACSGREPGFRLSPARGILGAMAPDNVEVLRRQFAAFEQGGVDAAAAYWHPDIDWRAVEGAADDIGVISGPEALRGYYEDWLETFDEMRAEVGEVLFEAGDQVAVAVHNSGRGRASGVATRGRYYVVCTVRDGVIESGREYDSREQALLAVGRESAGA